MKQATVMRDKTGDEIEKIPSDILSLKIWFSKVRDWNTLARFKNLKKLEIAGYEGDTFAPIAAISNLESLRLLHFPKLPSLSDIEGLQKLKELRLESLPSWDSSNKSLLIDSLHPVDGLKNLVSIVILGVKTRDGSQLSPKTNLHIISNPTTQHPKVDGSKKRP